MKYLEGAADCLVTFRSEERTCIYSLTTESCIGKGEGCMRISTKEDMRWLMLDLATEGNGKPVSIKDIV